MDRTSWGALGARPLVFPALALGLGVALGGIPGAPAWPPLGACLLLGAVPLWSGRRVGSHLLLLLAFIALGATLARLQSQPAAPDQPPTLTVLEGRVLRSEAAERCRVTLAVTHWDGAPRPARVQLSLYEAADCPLPGARIRVPARLRNLEGPQNPGAPDLLGRRLREGITHRGSADGRSLLRLSAAPDIERWMHAARRRLTRDVGQLAPSSEAGALFLTLAAGQRAALGPELEEVFSRSGLAHVLSVSGLHVAALALTLLAVLRRLFSWAPILGRSVDPRQLAAPLAIPLVWAFVAWTGWQAPAVRSALMASTALLALSVRRSNEALNTLAASAVLLLVVDPACIADLSMQLSFLAVLALVLLVPALDRPLFGAGMGQPAQEGWRGALRRAGKASWQSLLASVAVTLAGAPLIASVFGRLSLAGLLSNIVCMPLSGLLTLLAAGGAALHVVWPDLATPVLWAGGWASEAFLWVARFFSAAPLATLPVPPPAPGSIATFALGLIALAVVRGRWRWLGLMVPLAVGWTYAYPRLRPSPPLRITFLSVGQGDGIVISAGGRHALVDAGGVPEGADTGVRHVLPFLRDQGIEAFDLVVLSHPHPDHGLGLVSVLNRIPTSRLWLAEGTTDGALSRAVREAAGDAVVEAVSRGRPPFRLGDATLEVLGPPRDAFELAHVNDRSVVLKVTLGEVSVLLTGDIEAAGEAALEVGTVTVLKAPHHGSRTSSGAALLDRARPAAAVMTLGRHNRYGFPHPEVAARYRDRGIPVFRTDLQGAVTLESDGREARLHSFLPGIPGLPDRLVVPGHRTELVPP